MKVCMRCTVGYDRNKCLIEFELSGQQGQLPCEELETEWVDRPAKIRIGGWPQGKIPVWYNLPKSSPL